VEGAVRIHYLLRREVVSVSLSLFLTFLSHQEASFASLRVHHDGPIHSKLEHRQLDNPSQALTRIA
jgi:hypothetical protein